MLLISCRIYVADCWFFFFKQKTAYEMRISDWSSDVCSSDLRALRRSPVMISPAPQARLTGVGHSSHKRSREKRNGNNAVTNVTNVTAGYTHIDRKSVV